MPSVYVDWDPAGQLSMVAAQLPCGWEGKSLKAGMPTFSAHLATERQSFPSYLCHSVVLADPPTEDE